MDPPRVNPETVMAGEKIKITFSVDDISYDVIRIFVMRVPVGGYTNP